MAASSPPKSHHNKLPIIRIFLFFSFILFLQRSAMWATVLCHTMLVEYVEHGTSACMMCADALRGTVHSSDSDQVRDCSSHIGRNLTCSAHSLLLVHSRMLHPGFVFCILFAIGGYEDVTYFCHIMFRFIMFWLQRYCFFSN